MAPTRSIRCVELFLVCPNGFADIWKPGDHLWQIPVEHPASKMLPSKDLTASSDDDLPIYLDETGEEPETES